jgi:pimeloyl-ACP methyl ester carboxylesterase
MTSTANTVPAANTDLTSTGLTSTTVEGLPFTNSTAPGTAGLADLTVTLQGEGRPYLLLHGGAGSQSVAAFAGLLAAEGPARAITPIHPGFDGTPRPSGLDSIAALAVLYGNLLDRLGLEDVTVVGNSIGGWIAAELALLGSPRVGATILANAVGITVPEAPITDISGLSPDELSRLSFHDPAPFRRDPATVPAAQLAVMAANRQTLGVYAGGGPATTDPHLRGRLAGITTPTLVLSGESDGIVGPAYGRAFADAIPGAEFRVLPEAGHLPQLETPKELLAQVTTFTKSRPA